MLRRLGVVAASASSFSLGGGSPTIRAALASATDAFAAASVPEPALSAEHLLARAAGFGTSRGALSLHAAEPLDAAAAHTFEAMCARRLERVPVQFILGDWDFHDLTLDVEPPVLIPRPETEELVEHVLQAHSSSSADDGLAILDVGCGSGAIGLALLNRMQGAKCIGIDVSPVAVALSTSNAERCGLGQRYEAVLAEGGIASWSPPARSSFDVIVSNPPYIPRSDMATLEPEVAWHEDDGALCGGDDGLDVVRELLLSAPRLLRPAGPRAIWIEFDTSHPPLLERWLSEERPELGLRMVRWMRDAYGRPRFCEVRWDGEGAPTGTAPG